MKKVKWSVVAQGQIALSIDGIEDKKQINLPFDRSVRITVSKEINPHEAGRWIFRIIYQPKPKSDKNSCETVVDTYENLIATIIRHVGICNLAKRIIEKIVGKEMAELGQSPIISTWNAEIGKFKI